MATETDPQALVDRMAKRFQLIRKDSPALYNAFERIGMLVSARAKANVRRWGMIDTSRLINSLRYEHYKVEGGLGVKVGSFSVPYAALHEFGGPFKDSMRRAMFADLRRRGKLDRTRNKNVIQGSHFTARPYLLPAFRATRPFIIETLKKALGL